MPLHPDLDAFLALAAAGAQPMNKMSPVQARQAYDDSTRALDLDGPGAALSVRALALPTRDGHTMAARLYLGADESQPQPTLLYFHGGGYVLGGLDSHDSLCRDLAHAGRCHVLSVAYRLAPEHRFPTAFNDAEDAHRWLLREGSTFGVDTCRIAIGGDSVGGTLAAALCIAARNAGLPQPVLQLLLYPCTAAYQDSVSHARYGSGHLLEQATLQWMFGHCLRNEADRLNWRFAPLQAASQSGLAPAFIALAEFDPLLDEGVAYASSLEAAGVPTHLKVYGGMVHDFLRLGCVVEDAASARREIGAVLAESFR